MRKTWLFSDIIKSQICEIKTPKFMRKTLGYSLTL